MAGRRRELKSASAKKGARGTHSTPVEEAGVRKAVRGFPIVGIGASAGGLEALKQLFDRMPADTGAAFVVVTHQHPGHASLLPELLGKETKVRVLEAGDGMKVEPNTIYVAPSTGRLEILAGRLRRIPEEMTTGGQAKQSPRLPIDQFLRSLAEDQRDRSACIILSGTGTDGTLGLKAIKGESGMAMVQQPQSAKYAGMPASAISTGLADYVLPPDSMPGLLASYLKGPYLKVASAGTETSIVDAEPFQQILALLRARTKNDFSAYKTTTIRRRIERRMNVHQIEKASDYVRYMSSHPHEVDLLFKELLIGVTNFFRDPEAWKTLEPHMEELVRSRPENHTLRAWVAACATGEEAFSLAIVLRECMERLKRPFPVQIFGTDMDTEAIETARAAQYPAGIAVDVSPERLNRFFVSIDGTYRIRKEIRDMTIFAPQNLIRTPPFTRLDFLLCRNMLIYLNGDLQRKLLPIFHYALRPGGLMFLGPSETIGSSSELFETVDKRWRIFRRKEGLAAIHALPEIPAQPIHDSESEPAVVASPAPARELRSTQQIERLLLRRFAPASIVVNDRGDIFFIHGRTGSYLEPGQGEPRANILEMAREGLQAELSAALRLCVRTKAEVKKEGILVKTNGDFTSIALTVSRLQEPEAVRGLLLVTLSDMPQAKEKSSSRKQQKKKPAEDPGRISRLERELQYMKESHQTTLEELETTNEELKSTNEELQSTNEEMQSANEELETSKEEMQSLNEELTTVNAELRSKLDELSQANSDMQNLLNSTNIATVFLDNDLNIKRFTDKATDIVMLRLTDVGRPIAELVSKLEFSGLAAECSNVLKTLISTESEVHTHDGKWYLKRVMPYRTIDNLIDGVVITFVNIEQLKQAQRISEQAKLYFAAIVDTVREPLVVLNHELCLMSANQAFHREFRTTPRRAEGESIYTIAGGCWNTPQVRDLLEGVLHRNARIENYELEIELPKLGHRVFSMNGRLLKPTGDSGNLILLAFEGMTSTKT